MSMKNPAAEVDIWEEAREPLPAYGPTDDTRTPITDLGFYIYFS